MVKKKKLKPITDNDILKGLEPGVRMSLRNKSSTSSTRIDYNPSTYAKKSKAANLSGKSDKYINEKTNEWKQVVTIDADKIANAQQVIKDQQPAINKFQDELNKENGYKVTHDAYKDKSDDLAKQQDALKKAKKKADKKKIQSAIDSDKKQMKTLAGKIKTIENKTGYKKDRDAYDKANKLVKNAKKVIKSKKSLKALDKQKLAKYQAEQKKRNAKKKKAEQKANLKKIQKKMKAAEKLYQGRTAVYRADLKTDRLYMLAEVTPQENITINTNTNPKDGADTRTDYTVEDSKELSGTYYLYGKSWADRDNQYRILQGWARKGIEVVVKGFSKLAHCYITGIGKSSDIPYKNVLTLQLTFTYSMKYPIKYSKQKKKSKSLGKTSTTKGKPAKHKYVKVKAGVTLIEIARDKGLKISEIKKLNKKVGDLSLKPGQEVRIQ